MVASIPAEVLEAIEQLAAACVGDVPAMLHSARAVSSLLADDLTFAEGLEQAAVRRAAVGDRTGAWWLACGQATLRASPIATPQEDAEILIARLFGELSRSPASGPLPEAARWIVAGQPEPRPDASTIELARRNARTHVERLVAELDQRAAALRARFEAGDTSGFESAIASYAVGAQLTRASLCRTVDHVVGRTGDPGLTQAGNAAIAELDSATLPVLRARIASARALVAAPAPPPVALATGVDRPSFAGAAPPSFPQASTTGPVASVRAPAPAPAPAPASLSPVEVLDAAMRTAFETVWAAPGPESRAAFERAVRARYELETAAIPDPAERQRVLDHYVAHALTQLPPA